MKKCVVCKKIYDKSEFLHKTCSKQCEKSFISLKKLEERAKKQNKIQKIKEKKAQKKEKKLNSVKHLSKIADTLWSETIRKTSPFCQYCGSPSNLNAHHIFTRKNNSTRWEISNGITLCAKHHTFDNEFSAHRTPTEFTYWLEDRKGREYIEKLGELSRIMQHVDSEFLKEKIAEFKLRLSSL